MNWFQRYTILGDYFLNLLFFYSILGNSYDSSFSLKRAYFQLTTGLSFLSILPIGYFLVVLSQSIYYIKNRLNIFHLHTDSRNKVYDSDKLSKLLVESNIIVYSRIHDTKYSNSEKLDL